MPNPLVVAIAGSVGSAVAQKKAGDTAAAAQTKAADAQVAETKRQFDLIQSLMQPYVSAGATGLQYQLDLMGIGGSAGTAPAIEEFTVSGNTAGGPMGGPFGNHNSLTGPGSGGGSDVTKFKVGDKTFATRAEAEAYANSMRTGGVSAQDAQRAAIEKISGGEQFKQLVKQGEYGLLANASATGGLRGGDTQAALAEFRPAMLQSLIDKQLAQYGGLAANGQGAAAGLGGQAMNAAAMTNQALGDRGAAQAGAALSSGKAWGGAISDISSALGSWKGWDL